MISYTGYTSSVSTSIVNLSKLYATAKDQSIAETSGIWDELVSLIGGLVQDILNTAIGGNGRTIRDIINDVIGGVNGAINSVKDTIGGIVTSIAGTINGVKNDITDFIDNAVIGIGSKINGVFGAISQAVSDIQTGVSTAINDVIGSIGDTIAGVIQALVDKVNDVVNAISNIGKTIGEWITNAISDISEFITNGIGNFIDAAKRWIVQASTDISNWIVQASKDIAAWINNAVQDVGTWLAGVVDSVSGWIGQTIESITETYNQAASDIGDWFANVQETIRKIAADISAFFWKQVSNVGTWFARDVIPRFGDAVKAAQQLYGIGSKVWEYISTGNYEGAFNLLDEFARQAGIPAPVDTLHSLVSAIAYFWQTVQLQFIPMQVAAQRRAEIGLAMDPISNNEAAIGVFKGVWGEGDFIANAALAGQSPKRAKVALEAAKNLPTPGQTQQMFLRGSIDESQHDHILASYGFSKEYINEIKSLYAVIPSITDIITMAVKEAFSPNIAERFGQYQDLPEAFVSWAKKQGLSEEWAGRYWAAHWDLPSPQMGFQMYQRGIVDKEDLTLLLKALDVMPFWREKLIELAYNPLTRVDIRRMYKMEVITEEDVYKFHLDIGYSPENARLLTEFTKRYSAPEDQSQQDEFAELARSTYASAYKEHIISRDEYRLFLQGLKFADQDIDLLISLDDYAIEQKDKLFDPSGYRKDYLKLLTQAYIRGLFNRTDVAPMLVELGYTEDQAELELSLLDYNRELSIKDLLITQLHNQYVKFMIDEVDLHTILDTFGFYSAEVDRLLEEWGIERSFRDSRPSITDLKKFLDKGLISLDNFLDELRGMGYHEKYIGLYAQMMAKG